MPTLHIAPDDHYYIREGNAYPDARTPEYGGHPNTWQITAEGIIWLTSNEREIRNLRSGQSIDISEELVDELTYLGDLQTVGGATKKRTVKCRLSVRAIKEAVRRHELSKSQDVNRKVASVNVLPRTDARPDEASLVRCPFCKGNVYVRKDKLEKHKRKVHPG